MIEKLKIYLDTSVVSYLLQEDVPEKMDNTIKLWESFKDGKYDLYLSNVTLKEISKCPEPKRSKLFQYLDEIDYTIIEVADSVLSIADQLITMKILHPNAMMIVNTLQQLLNMDVIALCLGILSTSSTLELLGVYGQLLT